MAVINPPTWMQNRTDHTAQGDRMILSSLINPGVVGASDLQVLAQTTANMTVRVTAGRCFILGSENTYQGSYHCFNDATVNLTVTAASATLPRKDIVVARVYDAFYSGVQNLWALEVIAGTPAAAPTEPAVPDNTLKLASIDVAANATAINTSNIVDRRILVTSALNSGTLAVTSSTRPGSPFPGMEIYETDTGIKRIWTGTKWRWMGGTQIVAWFNMTASGGNLPVGSAHNITLTKDATNSYDPENILTIGGDSKSININKTGRFSFSQYVAFNVPLQNYVGYTNSTGTTSSLYVCHGGGDAPSGTSDASRSFPAYAEAGTVVRTWVYVLVGTVALTNGVFFVTMESEGL